MSDFLYKIYNVSKPEVRKQSVLEKSQVCRQSPFVDNHVKHHAMTNCQDPFTCSKDVPEPYKCYYCDIKTDSLVEFNKHVTEAQAKLVKVQNSFCDRYVCENCNFETYSRLILLKHVYNNCPLYTNGVAVMLVRLKTTWKSNKITLIYDKSVKRVNEMKWFKCDQCPFQTRQNALLRGHLIRNHTPPDAVDCFKCEQCSFKAKMRGYLTTHVLKEHSFLDNIRRYQCPECPFKATSPYNLKRHYTNKHALSEEIDWFECQLCSHKTKWKSHFRRHVREQHTTSEEFNWLQCEHCPYKAKQKIHMKLHTAQKHTAPEDIEWYECEHCPYKAKIKASLKHHVLKKHTSSENIDWFVCEKCGWKGLERSLLKKHMVKKHS